jgi:hypothetical protein
METLIGFIMIYTWVHGVIIIVKKLKEPTAYETAVMILGVVGFLLYIIGTVS